MSFLTSGKFRTMKLEDGETVVMLQRGKKARHPSDYPHAGVWGGKTGYLLVRGARPQGSLVAAARAFEPSLKDRSGDTDLLLLGPLRSIERVLTAGPARLRGRIKRRGTPEQAAHLWKYRKGVKL